MSSDGKYDDDEELRPQDASSLSSKQLQEELEKRGLKISGFADDDVKLLQNLAAHEPPIVHLRRGAEIQHQQSRVQ